MHHGLHSERKSKWKASNSHLNPTKYDFRDDMDTMKISTFAQLKMNVECCTARDKVCHACTPPLYQDLTDVMAIMLSCAWVACSKGYMRAL